MLINRKSALGGLSAWLVLAMGVPSPAAAEGMLRPKAVNVESSGTEDSSAVLCDGVRCIPDKDTVLNYIANGGGALFLRNSCGRSGGSLLPEVWEYEGMGRGSLVVTDKTHPVSRGLPERFDHGYADHACLRCGKEGKALLTDAEGRPAVIAGKVGEGKVIANVHLSLPGAAFRGSRGKALQPGNPLPRLRETSIVVGRCRGSDDHG